MVKKLKPAVIGLLILLLGLTTWYFLSRISSKRNLDFRKIYIKNQQIDIEMADTEDKRTKGLSGRASLTKDQGMLFIFPVKRQYSFWMKGMKFPLDFIWINGKRIVDVTENVPFPSADKTDGQLPMYSSRFPVDKVLEVNAGTIKKQGIKIGDSIRF